MFSQLFAPVTPFRPASLLLAAGLLLALCCPARAELMLHPTRVVFDKNMRAAQV